MQLKLDIHFPLAAEKALPKIKSRVLQSIEAMEEKERLKKITIKSYEKIKS